MDYVLDKYGLVRNGGVLAIYFPYKNAILPLRVVYRENEGFEHFLYGPLPISFSGYDAGVLPAGQRVEGITFPYTMLPAEMATDMFYYTEAGRVIHAHLYFSPIMLRVNVEIPVARKMYSYLGKVTQDLAYDFGWFRGKKEMVFLPKIHIGWDFYNPTNLDLRTNLTIVFGEYRVELVFDPEAIYGVVTRRYPAHYVTFGGRYWFPELTDALRILNVDEDSLIPILPEYTPKDQYLSKIKECISRWKR